MRHEDTEYGKMVAARERYEQTGTIDDSIRLREAVVELLTELGIIECGVNSPANDAKIAAWYRHGHA